MIWLLSVGVAIYTGYYAKEYYHKGNKAGGIAVGVVALIVLISPLSQYVM
ncbi:hypothetical protein [Alkalihalophilus marmarensis]|nr:hypothetical protein [Alkalihalophilus marmarensis]